jgi:hypothetical protein
MIAYQKLEPSDDRDHPLVIDAALKRVRNSWSIDVSHRLTRSLMHLA